MFFYKINRGHLKKAGITFILAIIITNFDCFSQNFQLTCITNNILECKSHYNEDHRAYTVITDSGLVQIDTYYFGWLTNQAKKAITDTLQRSDFIYLISTHAHSCHVRGNYCFNDAIHIAHKNVFANYNLIRTDAENEYNKLKIIDQKDSVQTANLIEAEIIIQLPNPEFIIDSNLSVNFGNINMHMYYFGNSGHSDSEILIHIPEENTLIIGQIFGRSYFLPVIKSNVTVNDLKLKHSIIDTLLTKNIRHILSNHQGRIAKRDLAFASQYYKNLLKDAPFFIEKGMSLSAFKNAFSLHRKYPDLIKRHSITEELVKQNQQNIEAVYNMFKN